MEFLVSMRLPLCVARMKQGMSVLEFRLLLRLLCRIVSSE